MKPRLLLPRNDFRSLTHTLSRSLVSRIISNFTAFPVTNREAVGTSRFVYRQGSAHQPIFVRARELVKSRESRQSPQKKPDCHSRSLPRRAQEENQRVIRRQRPTKNFAFLTEIRKYVSCFTGWAPASSKIWGHALSSSLFALPAPESRGTQTNRVWNSPSPLPAGPLREATPSHTCPLKLAPGASPTPHTPTCATICRPS